MIKIAIVEDDIASSQRLNGYLKDYADAHKLSFTVIVHQNPLLLLEKYTADYDVIFMDIKLPHINGFQAAKQIRSLDKKVILIFVTEMRQFAIKGYEVGALGYIVKPVQYPDLVLKVSRALKALRESNPVTVVVPCNEGYRRILPEDIKYIETSNHYIIFHTTEGEYEKYGTLSDMEKQLETDGFARCNNCFLVNLHYVKSIRGYSVFLDQEELQISQPRKSKFIKQFLKYTKEK